MTELMIWIAEAAASLPMAGSFRTSASLYGLLNAMHIFCIALLVGSILPVDLASAGLPGFRWAREAATPMKRLAAGGFVGLVFTGIYLFAVRPDDYLFQRPVFVIKMITIGLAVCNAAV